MTLCDSEYSDDSVYQWFSTPEGGVINDSWGRQKL